MLDLYFLIFALPAIVSVLLLIALRNMGELSPRGGIVFWVWYLAAFVLQFFGRSTAGWAIGLVMQVGLAIYLSLKLKFS